MSHPDLAGRPLARDLGVTTLRTVVAPRLSKGELRPVRSWFAGRSSRTVNCPMERTDKQPTPGRASLPGLILTIGGYRETTIEHVQGERWLIWLLVGARCWIGGSDG